jgi:hypothetical protein
MKPGSTMGRWTGSHFTFGDRFTLQALDTPVFVNQFAADKSLGRQDVALQRDGAQFGACSAASGSGPGLSTGMR